MIEGNSERVMSRRVLIGGVEKNLQYFIEKSLKRFAVIKGQTKKV